MKQHYALHCGISTLLFCIALSLTAQKKNESFQLHIYKTTNAIKIDGVIDSSEWAGTEDATDFFMMLPMDTSRAKAFTHVRMAYDDVNIYLVAECLKPTTGPYYVESLRRDFAFVKNDNFLVFMDPFDDKTNGFAFGTNAAGAQWDGMMYEGGKVDLNWDNKWISAVKNYPMKWILEMAIPFTTIRFKKGIDKWGINFSRLDLTTAE